MTAEWEAAHRKIQAEANAARSEAAKAQPRSEDGRRLASKSGEHTNSVRTSRQSTNAGAKAIAELSGANREVLDRGAPELVEAVELGAP